jgi:hypothetical protein
VSWYWQSGFSVLIFSRSRAVYKGFKIDWDIDECAEELPKPRKPSRKEITPVWRTILILSIPDKAHIPSITTDNFQAKKVTAAMNRFELLNMDGSDDGSHDDTFQTAAFMPTSIGVEV